jgi:hypothetical protein
VEQTAQPLLLLKAASPRLAPIAPPSQRWHVRGRPRGLLITRRGMTQRATPSHHESISLAGDLAEPVVQTPLAPHCGQDVLIERCRFVLYGIAQRRRYAEHGLRVWCPRPPAHFEVPKLRTASGVESYCSVQVENHVKHWLNAGYGAPKRLCASVEVGSRRHRDVTLPRTLSVNSGQRVGFGGSIHLQASAKGARRFGLLGRLKETVVTTL